MASPEEMAASMRANIKDKTNKSLAQWFKIIETSSVQKHGQIVSLLKKDYSVTHGFANLIAHDFLGKDQNQEIDWIANQYAGAKQDLKNIYNAIVKQVEKFGEVEIAPKKTYVSLRRNKQFALIQPSTKTRIDIGINLKGESGNERLEDSGSFNAMVSHRVRVTDIEQVDQQLINWLHKAYEIS